jgi:hypothetical protein
MFADEAKNYTSEASFRRSNPGKAPGLIYRHKTKLEKLAINKLNLI